MFDKKFLVPYNYYPIYVRATEEEESKFSQISSKMAACFRNGVLIDKDSFVKYVRARLRILSMAEEKIDKIDDLLKVVEGKNHFVVYCGDGRLFDKGNDEIRHIQFVKEHLDRQGIKTSQFTASEDMDRRMELVDMFNKNEIAALVEEIVRNKVKEDFNEAKTTDKKTVSKAIINELEAALKDED